MLGRRGDHRVEHRRILLLLPFEQVGVDVECRRNRAMAQIGLQRLFRHLPGHQAGVGVPGLMRRQITVAPYLFARLQGEVGLNGLPSARPNTSSSGLPCLGFSNRPAPGQGHVAAAGRGLRRDLSVLRIPTVADFDHFSLEVHVLPFEGHRLAQAKPGIKKRRPKRLVLGGQRSYQSATSAGLVRRFGLRVILGSRSLSVGPAHRAAWQSVQVVGKSHESR